MSAPNFAAPTATPFVAPTAPTAAPTASVTTEAIENDANEATEAAPKKGKKDKGERKPRQRSEVMISPEHISYVRDHVKDESYTQMAEKLGITPNQVNRILQEMKKRLRNRAMEMAAAAGTDAYAKKGTNDKGATLWDFDQPLTDAAKKVEEKIMKDLSRPADVRVGGAKGGGAVSQALGSEVDSILSDLGI